VSRPLILSIEYRPRIYRIPCFCLSLFSSLPNAQCCCRLIYEPFYHVVLVLVLLLVFVAFALSSWQLHASTVH
jgi:hypothetical protein